VFPEDAAPRPILPGVAAQVSAAVGCTAIAGMRRGSCFLGQRLASQGTGAGESGRRPAGTGRVILFVGPTPKSRRRLAQEWPEGLIMRSPGPSRLATPPFTRGSAGCKRRRAAGWRPTQCGTPSTPTRRRRGQRPRRASGYGMIAPVQGVQTRLQSAPLWQHGPREIA